MEPPPSSVPVRPRVLVVDDEEALRRLHARALARAGYDVVTAADGNEAMNALRTSSFDIILTDLDMPGMSGITLLEHVRAQDRDVPVLMITGAPSVDTAAAAMEYGALRYLVKPVDLATLLKAADDAVLLHRLARAKRQALELAGGLEKFVGDRAGLVGSFERALEGLTVAYQPIVSWQQRTVFAYEALLRSREPSLANPGAVLDAAERLDRVHDLGRRIRSLAVEPLHRLPKNVPLFLNLHPNDLLDLQLFEPDSALAVGAEQIVLEITERASLEGIPDVRERIERLRALGFRIAVDDLGAGYAGLTSFALLEPNIVKLDIGLVRNLHREPTKQKLVQTMIAMSKELGMTVTSEGIETAEERDALVRAGCDLMQGFLFARPGPAFPTPNF